MVAADPDNEGDPIGAGRRHGRDDHGCNRVRDGRNRKARRHAGAVARGQRLAGCGNGVGVLAPHPLRAQAGQLGCEHQEAVTGESARERDQPRIVAALRGDTRDQEQRRLRVGRHVEIPCLAGERHFVVASRRRTAAAGSAVPAAASMPSRADSIRRPGEQPQQASNTASHADARQALAIQSIFPRCPMRMSVAADHALVQRDGQGEVDRAGQSLESATGVRQVRLPDAG